MGNMASFKSAIRIILPLLLGIGFEWGDQGGSPCRRLRLDNEAPSTTNPVGTEAPPAISPLAKKRRNEMKCKRKIKGI